MPHETEIRFVVNDRAVMVAPDVSPAMTLLRWLRGPAGLMGTKEGCAEGDCGACTVVLEDADGGRAPVNACLVMLGQVHGARVRTVEGVRDAAGGPHALQRRLAEANATQCGFCTPGFVMAAWAHAREGGDLHEALAGNLCRCTGYRPILEALDQGIEAEAAVPVALPEGGEARFEAAGTVFHRPMSLEALLALRAAHPRAWLLAGGTDLGLGVAEGHRLPGEIIGLGGVAALQRIEAGEDGLLVGAGVSYAALMRAIEAAPALGLAALLPYLARLGSRQIRALGTVGGNLGTASPIGDMLPPLLALGAVVRLRATGGAREMTVPAFLRGYRRNALAADEIIEAVWVPRVPDGALFVCEKVSKRYDQDISTVSAAFVIEREGGVVRSARLAFGGMGPMAARAPGAEAALTGAAWSAESVAAAAAALADDFAPLSDLRAGATYRLAAAAGLLRRAWLRTQGVAVDVQAVV